MPRSSSRRDRSGCIAGLGALLGMLAAVLALLGIGVANLYISGQTETQIAQFPTLGASTLLSQSTGSTVAVEGRIEGAPRFQSLVAYDYQEGEFPSSNTNESRRWSTVEQIRPPLRVELSDGSVPITGTYTLSGPTITHYQGDEQRYVGLENRQMVFAWGTLRQEDAGPVLVAETIYAGTRADYLGDLWMLRVVGWIFIGLSIGLAALFTWIFTRFILPIAVDGTNKRQHRSTRRRRER
ncbi:MAG TPA: hypothetical protein VGD58_25355 [Herpetosiphonaceae bacterium]